MYSDNKAKSLHVTFPKTSSYVEGYDREIEWMYFLIEDDEVLKKYNTIWDKISADIRKEFDSESACSK